MATFDTFLTITDVAKRLNVCRRSVYRLIEEGMLRAIKLRGVYRISERDLQAFYEKAAERAVSGNAGDREDAR